MKERPILFNGEMVRAIFAGKKTQTRRVVDLRNSDIDGKFFTAADFSKAWADPSFPNDQYLHVPAKEDSEDFADETHRIYCKTQSGDRLWVRETFCLTNHGDPVYKADSRDQRGYHWGSIAADPDDVKWTPSIHMKYGQHRLTLEVTAVRVERLQDISEADARAEGSYLGRCECMPHSKDKDGFDRLFQQHSCHIHGKEFQHLWRSIYGDASWDANPWLWVYEFKIAERKDRK